ncbi:TetR/AcrR family transcriptional regulator [Pseudoxanthomonas suwonensis]|jgi:TetR/AcrR family transcriptional repressor of mexJK operon|uniref:TetR/AcrR family transcriptional regulator n=1 Tax=Pseudoxanthomonas suwonensis TaxID=314722 RepID=UPI00138EF6E9|nr:TetR/AcrR family transcriptional regulator [Pseudoxanthomonas suwonensis]KAF1705729.1 TetR family transcriptional regulator [Pseudoxanthomonas suwonensis]
MTRQTSPASVPAPVRNPGPGRPKDLAKRAAILDAAKRMFLEQGYQGVSMDQIAAAAGVSKLTVYSHFGDKETLFSEAIAAKCREVLPDELLLNPPEGPLRAQLVAIGHAFFTLISSEEALRIHRMMNTGTGEEALRLLFWNAGPRRVQDVFAQFLQARVDEGQLRIDDVPLAASQFFSLLKGELYSRMSCGLCGAPAPEQLARHLEATADFFLRAYAA